MQLQKTFLKAFNHAKTLPSSRTLLGRALPQRGYQPVLNSLSKNVISAEYAVRGQIPLRGEEIMQIIKQEGGHTHYQFAETTALNIGNPQKVGQGTITFNREVLAGMMYKPLTEMGVLSQDSLNRIETLSTQCKSPTGAYTGNSKGWAYVRRTVADFINRRDGVSDSTEDNIYLTNGASEAVRLCFSALLRNPNDGILIPIPQYPLYSALLTLNGGELLPYYLDESRNWGLDADGLKTIIEKAVDDGFTPRAIVVINPGNPTGQVMGREDLEAIIRLCHENNIMIMADEVYQQNVYKEGKEFVSMRKVLHEMGAPFSEEVELVSMNSVSKGVLGECGLRGGYMETHNLSNRAEQILYKLKSIELCSNTVGQIAVDLMVDPPHVGRESPECVDLYQEERSAIFNGMTERAKLLTRTFNDMKQISCTEIEGAMYGFPQLHFSQKFINDAKQQGKSPDFIYCLEMVNKTGIMTVPGSGFGQAPGTYHFRITNLVNPTSHMEQVLENLKNFNDEFHATH